MQACSEYMYPRGSTDDNPYGDLIHTINPATTTSAPPPPPPSPPIKMTIPARGHTSKKCSEPNCNKTANQECERDDCLKCCLLRGGCNHPSHRPKVNRSQARNTSTTATPTPPTLPSVPSAPPPPSTPTAASSSSAPDPMRSFIDPTPPAAPWFASQMRPLWDASRSFDNATRKQREDEEVRQQQKDMIEAEVELYVWDEVSDEPKIFPFQEGFTRPHFRFTCTILELVGMLSPGNDTPPPFVSNVFFLIPSSLKKPPSGFDRLLRQTKTLSTSHIRNGLQAEREAVRALNERNLINAANALPKVTRRRRSSSSPPSHSNKRVKSRRRSSSTSRATPSQSSSSRTQTPSLSSGDTHSTFQDDDDWTPPPPHEAFSEFSIKHEPEDDEAAADRTLRAEPKALDLEALRMDNGVYDLTGLSDSEADEDGGGGEEHERYERTPLKGYSGEELFYLYGTCWPSRFYVCEVADFFTKHQGEHRMSEVKRDFSRAFHGLRFVERTYSANRERWDTAPQQLKDAAYNAGFSQAGRWSVFAKAHLLLRDTPAKLARRKLKASGVDSHILQTRNV
ncbi:hypothetical protein BDZ89DRAFT_1145471 [Hymenopellis radicata]|nr:hypothetical protein BDZ89DRAFT_1145471 [Hymenopellis radicata]